MSTKWTPEQQSVISLRNCNLLVSAAAGSGKTAVLVERILSMIADPEHPADIDRLLVVTFTNAAAGEMKDRIRAAIEKRLEETQPETPDEERLCEHLQRQTSLLSNAQITTIHSFCQYVIRNYFHTIGLDPGLRIADEGEQKLLQNDVADDLLEEQYRDGREEFLSMAQCYAPGRDDRALKELVLSLYRFSISFPFPGEWLENCKKAYEISTVEELDASAWTRELMKNADGILKEVKEEISEALRILESCAGSGAPHPYLAAYQADLALTERILQENSYSGRCRAFADMGSWARLSAKKDARLLDEEKKHVRELREHYKELVKRLGRAYFYGDPEKIVRDMQKSAPALGALLDLTCLFADRFLQEKQKKGIMDFDDLEHYALQILVKREDGKAVPTQTAQELSARYEEVMIDEYQDSNLVQERILNAVSRIPQGTYNIFMVGDVKQSIYRFRLARPELFMEKYRTYSVERGSCRRISLHKNFRSRAEVLAGVNFLFEQLMQEDLGEVCYDEEAALYPGASFAGNDRQEFCNTEVLVLETGPKEEQPEETARELEARMAAGRIREIVGNELVFDKEQGSLRPARYKDIVILLRTMQGWAETFSKMFTDLGIPAHTGSGTGYFSTVEVQTVLSLLRLIDNPRQNIPLTAVLCSPIVGCSAKELADIRSAYPGEPFYEACMKWEKLRGFFAMLDDFRDLAVYTPIHELLWEVLERTGYGRYAAAMPGGSQRKANLNMLVEKAIAYEKGSYRGLYHFIRYIENLHKYDVDFGEAASFGEQEDVVRIMSIHKSKGLEFPIVFVCGMGKQMNQSDARASLIMHAGFGIGCDHVDPVRRTRTPTLLKRMLARRVVQESLGEELRVLYVAMTRAKEKLILTGTLKDLSGKLEKIHGVANRRETALPYSLRASASTYWDWILPALLRNNCMDHVCYSTADRDRQHPLYGRDSFISVRRISAENLVQEEETRQGRAYLTKETLLSLPPDTVYLPALRKTLEKNLSYRYPAAGSAEIPGKVSVSELKRLSIVREEGDSAQLYEEPVPVPLVPEFLKEKKEVSGAARGTIYHRLMECLDFTLFEEEDDTEGKLEAEFVRLVENGFLQEREAELVDRKKILDFLSQPIGKRMASAAGRGQLFRERQFVLGVPADTVNAAWPASERVLVQGIIDAYFIEEGGIVLVDYKTDFVKMKEASSLYEKYAVQLDYYEMALERLTHLRVREKMIYSFCLNRVLRGKDRDEKSNG